MKKFIAGALFGAILATTGPAFAAEGLQKIEAYIRPSLAITLNGQNVTVESPPVVYDGSTYLKLRDIASLTGLVVNWNDATQTVELVSSAEVSKKVITIDNASAQKTIYQGVKAIIYNGQTYVALFFYNDQFKDKAIPFDGKTRTINAKGRTINVDNADPNDLIVFEGDTYINTKLYEQP